MTWEEFIEVVGQFGGSGLITPPIGEAWAYVGEFDFGISGRISCGNTDWQTLPVEVWIAWGRYCETLKAEMDRCNGAGVCGGPLKVEVKG